MRVVGVWVGVRRGAQRIRPPPVLVWKESDPGNVVEVYCDTPGWAAIFLAFAFKTRKNSTTWKGNECLNHL